MWAFCGIITSSRLKWKHQTIVLVCQVQRCLFEWKITIITSHRHQNNKICKQKVRLQSIVPLKKKKIQMLNDHYDYNIHFNLMKQRVRSSERRIKAIWVKIWVNNNELLYLKVIVWLLIHVSRPVPYSILFNYNTCICRSQYTRYICLFNEQSQQKQRQYNGHENSFRTVEKKFEQWLNIGWMFTLK